MTVEDVRIRQADPRNAADAAAIVDLLNAYASDPMGAARGLPDEVRDRLPRMLGEHPTVFALLAFAGGRPVGVAVCFEGLSTFAARPLLNIHDLAVLPEWRGKGIGRAMLEAVEARAVERGCSKLTLEVREDNHRARGLYKSVGFDDGGTPSWRFLTKTLRASR